MGESVIFMAASMIASFALSAQQASQTKKAQRRQNDMILAQQEEAARLRREGKALPDAEGLAVEEARRRRLTMSKDDDKRRNSAVSLAGAEGGERKPLVLATDDKQGAST